MYLFIHLTYDKNKPTIPMQLCLYRIDICNLLYIYIIPTLFILEGVEISCKLHIIRMKHALYVPIDCLLFNHRKLMLV